MGGRLSWTIGEARTIVEGFGLAERRRKGRWGANMGINVGKCGGVWAEQDVGVTIERAQDGRQRGKGRLES